MKEIIVGVLAAIFLLGTFMSFVATVYSIFDKDYNDKTSAFLGLLIFCLVGVSLILLFG